MSTLSPVPNSQISVKDGLTPSWKSWFFQLYNYVTQIPLLATLASPSFSGTVSINGTQIRTGSGSPLGVLTGNPGDLYVQTDAGNGALWVKQSGTDNQNWSVLT